MTTSDTDSGYLQTLLRLGATLNSSLDLDTVLHTAIEEVVRFVRAERGFILLVDENTHRVWGMATHAIEPAALEATLSGKETQNSPEVSRTIVEQSLRQRRYIISLNAMEDPRFSQHTSVQLAQVRSVLCVPLPVQDRVLGVIYVDNRVKTSVFEERHAEMLSAFANQAAVAMENARLYENLRKSIEERLRLQQEVQSKETERIALEQANRLKSDFISFVSHELRNPLTAIRGFMQTLNSDAGASMSDEERAEFYDIIEVETDRLLNMINEMLDSSRIEANRPLTLAVRELDIRAILNKLARSQRFDKFWTPNHRIELDIAPELPEILADPDKITQVLTNLLSNAVKYSPQGGAVVLSARPAEGGVEIAVGDQGVGMNEEQCAKLFGRFERIERDDIKKISGTGLGLYLTRHLVELHGGRIECDSKPGEGSTFRVFLPPSPPHE